MVDHLYEVSVSESKFGNDFQPRFFNKLQLEAHDEGYKFDLLRDFSFLFCWDIDDHCVIEYGDTKKRNYVEVTITAKQNFTTDLISSPRPLWSLFPPFGSGMRSSVTHDVLYRFDIKAPSGKLFTQKDADKIFKVGLCVEKHVSTKKLSAMYKALRLMGFRAWEENRS